MNETPLCLDLDAQQLSYDFVCSLINQAVVFYSQIKQVT